MRRRRQAKPPANPLRRLALAGRWDEVRALLAERLVRDPYDEEARAELERLNQGLPLRATESALERRRREGRDMQEELAGELARYRSNPAMPAAWEPALVSRRRKRVMAIRRALGAQLGEREEEESAAYLAALTALWRQHRRRKQRRWLLGAGLPLLALTAALLATSLHHRAGKAEDALQQAIQARDIPRVELALRAADSGLNRLSHAELPERIRQARVWLASSERLLADVQQQLSLLETGEGSISSLPLARRAALERGLHNLPAGMDSLRERWQRLCDKEAQALAAQQEDILQRFRTPLPPLPELSGSPAHDDARLKAQQDEMQALQSEWLAARELFGAEEALGTPLAERLEALRELREDITALRRTIALLPTARSYARYRELLDHHRPRRYAPALRMQDIRDLLPEESKLRDMMQNHGRQLPPGMREAARHALLEGGASFTPAFPANAQQVHIMEDLFTDTCLQKELYEMSARTLPSVIVEERPEVNEHSVRFTPSPLSPGYTLDTPRRITWHNPQGVFIRRIDTTPLLREAGISRGSFFREANLPTLLGKLLRLEHRECPALARAYVIKRLLEVMAAHEWPTMLGIAYAPTLRADARSFRQLLQALPLPLEAGCWLLSTPKAAAAETACAAWLHERRHRHYEQEIARNVSALVHVHPRYVGFISGEGKPTLYRNLPNGTLLWYMAEGGLTATPLGEALEAPIPYSPAFIVAKD